MIKGPPESLLCSDCYSWTWGRLCCAALLPCGFVIDDAILVLGETVLCCSAAVGVVYRHMALCIICFSIAIVNFPLLLSQARLLFSQNTAIFQLQLFNTNIWLWEHSVELILLTTLAYFPYPVILFIHHRQQTAISREKLLDYTCDLPWQKNRIKDITDL